MVEITKSGGDDSLRVKTLDLLNHRIDEHFQQDRIASKKNKSWKETNYGKQ